MVSSERVALNAVDRLLGLYLAFLTLVIVARGGVGGATGWLFAAHALFGILLVLFTRLRTGARVGRVLHDLYPLILVIGLYAEIGILNAAVDPSSILAADTRLQGWEEALFGAQLSYEWIRRAPSVFWSATLHVAYMGYFPIVAIGPLLLEARGQRERARWVLLVTMVAYVACYTVFALWPAAGPNYAFPHPTGPVRDVWSARATYGVLAQGSSFGAAFPSSHVAAAAAAVAALWRVWRPLSLILVLPASLLVIATVYCQMHYAVDALAGLAVAAAALAIGWRVPVGEPGEA
jgi:membrane-associated phospholipid phosphatase